MSIIQVISTLLVAIQVCFLYKQLKEGNQWSKIQATLIMVNRYAVLVNEMDDKLLDEIKLISFQDKELSLDEIKCILDNISSRKQLFMLCDFFEEMAIGIKYHYLNEQVLFEQLYSSTIKNFDNLYGYIQLRRLETKMNVCGHFEWLVKRWKNKN